MPSTRLSIRYFRIFLIAVAVAMISAACGGSTPVDSAAPDPEPADEVAAEVEEAVAPASLSLDAQASAADPAVVPNDICRDGAAIAGVLDPNYFSAVGLQSPDTAQFGSAYDADKWLADATPLHSCSLFDLSNGARLTVYIRHSEGSFSEIYETADIGGTSVDFVSKSPTNHLAVVNFDNAASPTGLTELVLDYIGAEGDQQAAAVLRAIADRTIPNVTFVAP